MAFNYPWYRLTNPDSTENAVDELKRQAREVQAGKSGETPIKLANIMRNTKAESQDTVLLKEAVQGIFGLHANLVELTARIGEKLDRVEYAVAGSGRRAASLLGGGGSSVDLSSASGQVLRTDVSPTQKVKKSRDELRDRLPQTTPKKSS